MSEPTGQTLRVKADEGRALADTRERVWRFREALCLDDEQGVLGVRADRLRWLMDIFDELAGNQLAQRRPEVAIAIAYQCGYDAALADAQPPCPVLPPKTWSENGTQPEVEREPDGWIVERRFSDEEPWLAPTRPFLTEGAARYNAGRYFECETRVEPLYRGRAPSYAQHWGSLMSEQKWPWRARFAHWMLGLISPWLALTPVDKEVAEEEYDRQHQVQRSIYEKGVEDGHHRTVSGHRRDRGDQW